MSETDGIKIVIKNRKAFHDFHIIEKFEAGVSLNGTEVKSIRDGRVNLQGAYAKHLNGSIFLVGMHISTWQGASDYDQHDPVRTRQLLLHRREIRKIVEQIDQGGMTLVPLMLYFKHGKLKVELGLAKGKRQHDKREAVSKREAEREMARARSNKYS